MPTVVLPPGSTIFLTGVNGLIGSHIADQLIKHGYKVRGAVRNIKKSKWLLDYFDGNREDAKFSLVEVPDMAIEGCYDNVLQDIDGFIHVASPMNAFSDASTAVFAGVAGGLNALTACAKTPSVQRFVFTSSSIAASFTQPNIEFSINENSFNEKALKIVGDDPHPNSLCIYAAVKTATEKAMWKWVKENDPKFVVNAILPNANFGRVLISEHQSFPSTIGWARAAWTGENLSEYMKYIDPQWFISTTDTALLHISALIHSEVTSERLFGFAETFNFNQMLEIFRGLHPERKFPEDTEGLGTDRMTVPNQRAEEVLKWLKGRGWDNLETSLKEMSESWV